MGSGPGEVWSGPDETAEIRLRRQPLDILDLSTGLWRPDLTASRRELPLRDRKAARKSG